MLAPLPDEILLREALEIPDAVPVALRTREPLGAGTVTGFEVVGADGHAVTYFVDTSGRPVAQETGLATGTPEAPEERIWLHPQDPHLPALAAVAFGGAARTLLHRIGRELVDPPELVAYRPGRRAVFRVVCNDGIRWAKVIRPERVERIVGLHARLADAALHVPQIEAWADAGLLVLPQAPGRPAVDVAPPASALLDEVDRWRQIMAGAPLENGARSELPERAEWYTSRLAQRLEPEAADRLRVDAARVGPVVGDGGERTVIHGDLHFGQLFLDDAGRMSGVIDVDTAGLGTAADDSAAFISHALASAALAPGARGGWAREIGVAALERWDDAAAHVRERVAVHLWGHALGADDLGDAARRDVLLATADALLADEDVPKDGLMDGFGTP